MAEAVKSPRGDIPRANLFFSLVNPVIRVLFKFNDLRFAGLKMPRTRSSISFISFETIILRNTAIDPGSPERSQSAGFYMNFNMSIPDAPSRQSDSQFRASPGFPGSFLRGSRRKAKLGKR
jgi:hypothetical protein